MSTEIHGSNPLPNVEESTNIIVMFGGEIKASELAQLETVFAI